MSDEETTTEEDAGQDELEKKPSPVKSILFSVLLALVMGVVAAGSVYLFAPTQVASDASASNEKSSHKSSHNKRDVTYVNLEPLVVTLGPDAQSSYLKISVTLETTSSHEKTLIEMMPRFRDVLISYLRAVDENDLIQPSAMIRLRAQMLRRLQLVGSEEAVNDVLITDFVLT